MNLACLCSVYTQVHIRIKRSTATTVRDFTRADRQGWGSGKKKRKREGEEGQYVRSGKPKSIHTAPGTIYYTVPYTQIVNLHSHPFICSFSNSSNSMHALRNMQHLTRSCRQESRPTSTCRAGWGEERQQAAASAAATAN